MMWSEHWEASDYIAECCLLLYSWTDYVTKLSFIYKQCLFMSWSSPLHSMPWISLSSSVIFNAAKASRSLPGDLLITSLVFSKEYLIRKCHTSRGCVHRDAPWHFRWQNIYRKFSKYIAVDGSLLDSSEYKRKHMTCFFYDNIFSEW